MMGRPKAAYAPLCWRKAACVCVLRLTNADVLALNKVERAGGGSGEPILDCIFLFCCVFFCICVCGFQASGGSSFFFS